MAHHHIQMAQITPSPTRFQLFTRHFQLALKRKRAGLLQRAWCISYAVVT